MRQETSSVRVYKEDLKKIWNLVTFERKTIADVVNFLLNFYEETRAFNEEAQVNFGEVKEQVEV